jgi:hypothetical protein
MFTLEPVYRHAGGSPDWVAWFMNNLIHQPSLAFGFTQAGQENSFGWDAMKTGLTLQVALLANQARAGEIQIKTLAQAGQWFRDRYPLTPPTSVVALDDWKKQDRKSVWYDSRFYRINLFWEKDSFFIRDLHRFDETVVSVTHAAALTNTSLVYGTLPVMDGALWSGPQKAGIWPVLLSADGTASPMVPEGVPAVKALNSKELGIRQPLRGGGSFSIVCGETNVTFCGLDEKGQPLHWAWDMVGGDQQKSAVRKVASKGVSYNHCGTDYEILLAPGEGLFQQLENGSIRLCPASSGKLVLVLALPCSSVVSPN